MPTLARLYTPSLALLTDLYQLTMAYGYWKTGVSEREAVFNLFYRRNPFGGGYAIACGLAYAAELLERFRFTANDLAYLSNLRGNDDRPLFEPEFLAYLRDLDFSCDVDAIGEGTVVFPHQPLVRMKGPIIQCQLLETPLLNIINFQTLIATKSARICQAARGEPVLEFGLRRAQGVDGALAASRAAFVGGCAATSNVLAGRLFDIPVKGTHAHSWVMCFDSELESFQKYARAMPNNCVFLVDTYDTLEGVEKAVTVGKWLRERGHEMVGIRLDSGDLAELSIRAREILDRGGFPDASIVASNDLDEYRVEALKERGATINVWGIGTRMVTAYQQPALGGVYKLAAVRDPGEDWAYKVKLSEQPIKVSNPGIQQVRRFVRDGEALADAIYDVRLGIDSPCTLIDPMDATDRVTIPADTDHEDLLIPIFDRGHRVYPDRPLPELRARTLAQLDGFDDAYKRLDQPEAYPVGLESKLHELKARLMAEAGA